MQIGEFWKIKRDNGKGVPMIRIEAVSPEGVIVSDWLTPEQRFKDVPLACGTVRPNPRRFATSPEEALNKLRRYWQRMKP